MPARTLPFQSSPTMRKYPAALPDGGLLVGWSMETEHVRSPIGFNFGDNTVIEGGGRIVLVENLAAFTARYGDLGEGMVAGQYTVSMANSLRVEFLRTHS